MSAFNFPKDMRETLKSLDLVDNPNSWKIENLGSSFVLTVVWQKTKQSDIARETVKSSFEGRSREEKEEETTKDVACKTRIGAVNSNSYDRGVVSAEMNYLKQVRNTPTSWEERKIDQIKTETAINKDKPSCNSDLFCEPHGSENMNRLCCRPNSGSSNTSSIQTNALKPHSKSSEQSLRLYGCYSNRLCSKQARCACGDTFILREDAIRHVMSNCPVSLCFRIELDIKVNQIIDQWKSEAIRISGRKWWHLYKTSGFPDVSMSFPENALDDIEVLINKFIDNSSKKKLLDKTGHRFVLIEGLEDLPTEECLFTQ